MQRERGDLLADGLRGLRVAERLDLVGRLGEGRQVDAGEPALAGAAAVHEGQPHAVLRGGLRDLGGQRGDAQRRGVDVRGDRAAGQLVQRRLLGGGPLVGEAPAQLVPDGRADLLGGDARAYRVRQAVVAEADAEQGLGERAELLEVALVVVAVAQAVEVQRLGADRVHAVPGQLGDQRGRVLADLGVGRAQLGEVAVAEGVGGRAVGVLEAEPVVVAEDRPGVQLQAPAAGLLGGLGERVAVADRAGRRRGESAAGPAGRVGAEVRGAGLQVPDHPPGVVREDVAGLVVDRGEGDAADPGPVGEVAEERVGALVDQVGGEGEDGRLHGAAPEQGVQVPSR